MQFLWSIVGVSTGLDDRHLQSKRRQVLVNFGQIKRKQNFAVGWSMAQLSFLFTYPSFEFSVKRRKMFGCSTELALYVNVKG